MTHSSGGVIHLDDSNADGEEVGSDVEEVVTWDSKLHETKTFLTGFLSLSGRRFDSPNLDEQQRILFSFIDQPAHDYFLSRSLGEMDKIRVELPCVHARLNNADAGL